MDAPPSLLEATFLHSQGIGRTTEHKLWQAGARDWSAYLAAPDASWPLTRSQRALLTPTIVESQARLAAEDHTWFAQRLPQNEHWRSIASFGHRLAFLDIETTGGMGPEALTVVGVYDGWQMRQFVKGHNLAEFPQAIADAAVLVTFFGTGFDIPFLRRAFPDPSLFDSKLHVDLCFLLKKLGYRGSLKSIEPRFGIQRSAATCGLSGWDAVRLWREYRAGRPRSLETLLAYNAEDVRNMAVLLKEGYQRMLPRLLRGE